MRKIILFIVYGENQTYYDGAKFSYLTLLKWFTENDDIEFVVLTEKPEEFSNYPLKIFSINEQQKDEWSLNGNYHFRIKNRGVAYIMDKLNLHDLDKIIYFDTDTYFNKSPRGLFSLINKNQARLYLNEGLIYKRSRVEVYIKHLEGQKIKVNNEFYELYKSSSIWGSLMIGLMANMRPSLDWADKLMLEFYKRVPVHTIEEFSLSESLKRKYLIVEGKRYVSLYSTSRKKEYCSKVLNSFFKKYASFPIEKQVILAQKVKMKRPIHIVLNQRFQSLFKKNVS